MRNERHREAESLLDLGLVLVASDLVRREVLEDEPGMRSLLEASTGTGHARLRVDDDAGGIDHVGERMERKQGRSRVAARVRDQATRGGRSSGTA